MRHDNEFTCTEKEAEEVCQLIWFYSIEMDGRIAYRSVLVDLFLGSRSTY